MDSKLKLIHKSLAGGRWRTFTFYEQMANIGAEVGRALNWAEKGNAKYSRQAFERALELLWLTLDDPRHLHCAKELARLHEVLVDYFPGENEFKSSPALWRKYFDPFAFAARKNR